MAGPNFSCAGFSSIDTVDFVVAFGGEALTAERSQLGPALAAKARFPDERNIGKNTPRNNLSRFFVGPMEWAVLVFKNCPPLLVSISPYSHSRK